MLKRPWSDEEIQQLNNLASNIPAWELARLLNRTEGALRQKAFSLGLSLAAHQRRANLGVDKVIGADEIVDEIEDQQTEVEVVEKKKRTDLVDRRLRRMR